MRCRCKRPPTCCHAGCTLRQPSSPRRTNSAIAAAPPRHQLKSRGAFTSNRPSGTHVTPQPRAPVETRASMLSLAKRALATMCVKRRPFAWSGASSSIKTAFVSGSMHRIRPIETASTKSFARTAARLPSKSPSFDITTPTSSAARSARRVQPAVTTTPLNCPACTDTGGAGQRCASSRCSSSASRVRASATWASLTWP